MTTGRYIQISAAYLVVTFIFAAGWHLVLFKSTYDELAIFTRKEPLIPLGLVSMFLQAIIIPYLYSLFAKERSSVATGLRFGLILGVLMASIAVFAEAGKQEVSSLSTWIVLESVYYLLQFGVAGVVTSLLYGSRPDPK